METQQSTLQTTSVRSVGIRYGLIAAVIGIIYFLILALAGLQGQGAWSIISYVLIAVIIFLAHKYYKENTDGFLSYGKGINIAVWMGLINSVISSIFSYIYIKFVDTSFMEVIKEKQIEEMEKQGMSDEQIEQAMQFASWFTSPESIFIMGLIGTFIMTIIIALIVTIFTQKKNPEVTF